MPKILITEQQVINVAKLLIINGKPLTIAAIRFHLGTHGSDSTIHKYLKRWKEECFKKFATADQDAMQAPQLKLINNYEFLEEKRDLEQSLNKQIAKNEHYAQELINAEKANVTLKEENRQLQTTNQELQLRLTEAKAANHSLEQVTQEIKNRLDANDNKTFINMQQTINDLKVELKTLNETSLIALRETSAKGHDALMQEKVTSINLQAKIDSLNKELAESRKQLDLEIIKTKLQTQLLSRHIEWLQTMLQEHLGLTQEKLRQLEEEGSPLNFTSKAGATSYGK